MCYPLASPLDAPFKLDENPSAALKLPLLADGHDVATVAEQSLRGASDSRIAAACKQESRCLITADQDFAQILSYPPEEYAGIVVLWHPRPTLQRLEKLVRQVVVALKADAERVVPVSGDGVRGGVLRGGARQLESAVFSAPSAIVPDEKNYLLNPAHLEFRQITFARARPFSFDPRMWK